ncbi:type II toxin-antitoxin system PemK/MazF family toxin [Sulfurovum sp.]|jgi:mRNA interferase MazF|uniref:type II toxin-antitoxin system PemK/MazF family toxin n=1 Tax=Sulfurovum sp. TaxID=1969726 RepID=UPI0025DC0DFF|nr:type II toxin-antitoxin system PemK/MazF family toxin [Sulfurovum sp.]
MHFSIYWADLNPVIGREQAGHRPVLVVSNDIENQMDIVTIIPVTSRKKGRHIYPNEVLILLKGKEAILLCHQVRTISKKRLDKKMAILDQSLHGRVLNTLCMRFE